MTTDYKVWMQVERRGKGRDYENMGQPVAVGTFETYEEAERHMLRVAAAQPDNDLTPAERGAALTRESYNESDRCDDCGQTPALIGCPDGAQICQRCFDAGAH